MSTHPSVASSHLLSRPHLWVVDRTDGSLKVEKVTLGPFMKWLFTSSSALSSYVRYGLSRALWLSHIVGWLSHQSLSRSWIEPFIKDHQIDMQDFEVPLEGFAHFDAFFSRKLKAGARPFSKEPGHAIMPADARYRRMQNQDNFEIKGQPWSLNSLLGPLVCKAETQTPSMFHDPLIARLCPTDYHRFHSPVDATVGRIIAMGDCLHSVHAWCLDRFPEVLSENKRVAIELLTDEGRWVLVAIGATCVGSIELFIESGQKITRGAELGSFHFGGSCLVMAHEAPNWQEADDLQLLWKQHPEKEIFSKMGEPMKIKI